MSWVHQFDINAFRAINLGMHRNWLDTFFAFFSYLGLGIGQTIFSLLFIFLKNTRRFVLPMLIAAAVGGFLFADGLKELIPRDRPSNLSWAIREEPIYLSSFPSGHTTTSFAVSTMLLFLTWHSKLRPLGVASMFVAALIGLSRIYRGVHWPTDVIAGTLLGVAAGCLLYLILPKFGLKIEE